MRYSALFLVASACVAESGDPGGDDDPGEPFVCARSALGETIYQGTLDVIDQGTVPASLYATTRNTADPTVLIDGPAIFPAFRDLIASAEHDVVLQTYVWEVGSDPANDILAGIAELARRRAGAAPDAPPVTVRFVFDASTIGFGSNVAALPKAWASVEALALDPRRVRFELASFQHLAMGNLHVKTVVVDGKAAIITGANPQAHHDYVQPWRDSGYRVSGDVAAALLADFDDAWYASKLWTCGAREDLNIDACSQPTQPVQYTIVREEMPADTCTPMMVVTRQADINPLSNRTDNPQDQALLTAFAAARSHIRMQTPNLNDDAAKAALIAAVNRGVRVDVVLSKGFNDATESAPGQGGTNDQNVTRLYDEVVAAGVTEPCAKLRIRWYSRDGLSPVEGNGVYASHVKYASIDDAVVIAGTANMDTQSWNNSREVNILVDDADITQAWDEQLFVHDFDNGIAAERCFGVWTP